MSLKLKYLIWICTVHMLLAVSCYFAIIALDMPFLILGLELIVVTSLFLSIWFYKRFQLPLNFIKFNKQAILEEDFNLSYLKTDHLELNELYEMFNAMLGKIMHERRNSEEQQHFLKNVINVSPAGIILLDYDDKIELINPIAKKMFDMDDDDICKSLKESNPILQNIDLSKKEASFVNFGSKNIKYTTSSFYYRGFRRKMIMIYDLTIETLRTEKKSYSKVIRMMAHEINNSIGPINSILHVIGEEYPNDPMLNRTVKAAIQRTESLNKFMQNFASVVRLPDPSLEPTDLIELLRRTVKVQSAIMQKLNIEVEWLVPLNHIAKMDVFQMEQVMINIFQNCIDSLPKGGKIILELNQNILSVRDNGQGISNETAKLLFSPFFTTKPTGQGIGLTIIKHVLSGHDFGYSLRQEGKWTTFKIIF